MQFFKIGFQAVVATVFRSVCPTLCFFRPTYLPGMVLVRTARQLRKLTYRASSPEVMKTVSFLGKFKMRVNRNGYIGGTIFWTGFHQLNELLFLKRFLKPGMTVVDVGANQGEFTIYAASLVKHGKVLAFEPVEKQRNCLIENLRINRINNVSVLPYGLSNEESVKPVFTSFETNLQQGVNEGLSSLYPSDSRNSFEQEIELKIFDNEHIDKLDRIDLIKIDIEGAELFALKGMIKSIKKFNPLILLEINSETFRAAGYTTSQILDFMNEAGYRPNRVHRGKFYPAHPEKVPDWCNYLFIPQ